jgi:hypothetical protein
MVTRKPDTDAIDRPRGFCAVEAATVVVMAAAVAFHRYTNAANFADAR